MAPLNENTIGKALRVKREGHTPIPTQETYEEELSRQGIPSTSQAMLSRVERGRKDFTAAWPAAEHRLAVLRTYGFKDYEIRQLDQKFKLGVSHLLLPEGAQRVSIDGPKARHFGPVNAGLSLTELSKEEVELLSVPDWIADRYDLDQVFSMDIVGNSMACEDVHKSIPEGSRVYFLEGAQPNPGETVCARLYEEGLHVIKIYKPQQGYAILESYNHEHQPIIVNEDRPGDVVGVYLTHIPRGPRLR